MDASRCVVDRVDGPLKRDPLVNRNRCRTVTSLASQQPREMGGRRTLHQVQRIAIDLAADKPLPFWSHPGAAELNGVSRVTKGPIPRPAAQTITAFEHEDGPPRVPKISRRRHPGETPSDNDRFVVDVGHQLVLSYPVGRVAGTAAAGSFTFSWLTSCAVCCELADTRLFLGSTYGIAARIVCPPSTKIVLPVRNVGASNARYSITLPISSASATRPTGLILSNVPGSASST